MSYQSPHAILSVPIAVPRITSTARTSTFDYYGAVGSSLALEASKFLTPITDVDESELTSTITAFISATQKDCVGEGDEKKACWFTIRVTKPSDAFEVPRWHQDGRMFSYDEGREKIIRSKYALTLLGPMTLMLEPDENAFATQRKGQKQFFGQWETDGTEPTDEDWDEADSSLREWLANEFKHAPRVQVGHGEVVRFSWGRDDSPIHSEPDLTSDRVFMTVLYGSESELRDMCNLRNAKYGEYCAE